MKRYCALIFRLILIFVFTMPNIQLISAATYTVDVDFSSISFYPLLKSKIGIARSLNIDSVVKSLPYMDEIRPALFSGELRFPETTWSSLNPYPVEVLSDGIIQVQGSEYLLELHQGLRSRNIEIVHQLIGAPKQWHPYDKAQTAGAKFPRPVDIDKSAEAMKLWTQQYSYYPVTWCVWNEPSHNLTGARDQKAVTDINDIYQAYYNKMKPVNPKACFGMANFIPWDCQDVTGLAASTYLQAALVEYFNRKFTNPGLELDYLTMNNYGTRIWDNNLFETARQALGTDANKTPLMLLQYGPFNPNKEWDQNAGLTTEAVKSMNDFDRMLKIPDLQIVTFAGWIGHLLRWNSDTDVQKMPLYYALKLYSQMPYRRVNTTEDLPSSVQTMASADENRAAIMLWNDSSTAHTIKFNLTNIPSSILKKATNLTVYKIDKYHGSPLEGSKGPLVPIETITITSADVSKSIIVEGPGIVYIQIDNGSGDQILDRGGLGSATLLKKHYYNDRIKDEKNYTYVRESYGAYDTVRASAFTGMNNDNNIGRAIIGAEYENLPDKIDVSLWTDKISATIYSDDSILGIRVDYVVNDSSIKSVLWKGDIFNSVRTKNLPWGKGGTTADVLITESAFNKAHTGNRRFTMNLAANAPDNWKASGSRAILSFWMESTGKGSQAIYMLSPVTGTIRTYKRIAKTAGLVTIIIFLILLLKRFFKSSYRIY